MNCTHCKQGTLQPARLDDLFPCHTCDNCLGNWIYLADYLTWKETCGDCNVPIPEHNIVFEETKKAILCPETGGIMIKYRISQNANCRLDLSPAVNGIWLNNGEWDLLKQEKLATELNHIFTEPWQKQIRDASAKATLDAIYASKFGQETYAELKRIREWLKNQNQRADMIGFLSAQDPYKP